MLTLFTKTNISYGVLEEFLTGWDDSESDEPLVKVCPEHLEGTYTLTEAFTYYLTTSKETLEGNLGGGFVQ